MFSAGATQTQNTSTAAREATYDAAFALVLAAVVLALYGSSVGFGLTWDDPNWYRLGTGVSVWQVLSGLSNYQFYRPLAVLVDHLFVSPAGVVNAPLAHAVQVSVHLASSWLSVPALRAFQFKPWHARLSALIFAVYPLSYQAVAWQVPQQPCALMFVLLAVWTAQGFRRRRQVVLLGLSGAAFAAALLYQENALPFVFLFFWLAYQESPRRTSFKVWPLLHLGVALVYLAIWLRIPRLGGVTGAGFQPVALGYLLQSLAFVPAHLATGWLSNWPTLGLVGLYALIGLMLAAGAWKIQGRGPASLSCVWIAAGLLPPWAGLSWLYVQASPRLVYPAALGIASLWGAWAAAALTGSRWWVRGLGWATLIVVLGVSAQQWYQSETLYQRLTRHLAEAVQALARDSQAHLLFVNFPDTVEMRPAPYPLGAWGLFLAPVVQDLGDYARAETGTSAADRSRAAVQVGAAERGAWPYAVALRGQDSDPATLLEQAAWADQVYLSDYQPGGLLSLRAVGHVLPQFSATPALARLGDAVELGGANLSAESGLTLAWRVLKAPQAADTIFVHYWKDSEFVGGQDGDSLDGLIPPAAWQPGTEVVDIRPLPAGQLGPGRYEVRAGLYHRSDGSRYPAYAMNGERYPNDEVPVGTLVVP